MSKQANIELLYIISSFLSAILQITSINGVWVSFTLEEGVIYHRKLQYTKVERYYENKKIPSSMFLGLMYDQGELKL